MVRKAGLIVNDGKELAVQTAISVEKKLEKSNYEVVRVSSSGGMVGFANPDQHVRPLGSVSYTHLTLPTTVIV